MLLEALSSQKKTIDVIIDLEQVVCEIESKIFRRRALSSSVNQCSEGQMTGVRRRFPITSRLLATATNS